MLHEQEDTPRPKASPSEAADSRLAVHLKSELVLDALNMAVWPRRLKGVIHDSDQGRQYTSIAFGLRCREAGIRPSTASIGQCFDNAMCRSFFTTLQCELLDRPTTNAHTAPAKLRRANTDSEPPRTSHAPAASAGS